MDESLTCLIMILGLETWDVMYSSSKASGSYTNVETPRSGKCKRLAKSVVTPLISSYTSTPAYQKSIRKDEMLYESANRSLDKTIDALGRDEFELLLQKYRRDKAAVDEACSSAEMLKLPCLDDGKKRPREDVDCMLDDMGCGMGCIDNAVARIRKQRAAEEGK